MTEDIKLGKEHLYHAFIVGAKAVINEKNHLNEINVFPVRDGDTGSNLSSMMNSIIKRAKIGSSLKETLDSISNAALIGSRGNSGLIFSQFFYGFTKEFNEEYMDQNRLILQMKQGFLSAYESIEVPVEGTIITLMRKWFEFLKRDKKAEHTLYEHLITANNLLQEQLFVTMSELEVLKTYNVVDAGAKGFSLFIDGFVKGIVDPNIKVEITESDYETFELSHEHTDDVITNRFCTEILIESSFHKEEIISQIHDLGDSIVVGESTKYRRIHLHTNTPELVIERLRHHGKIVETKVDDMKKQADVVNHRKHDICIVTDSIADLPKEYIEAHQIQIFPVSILVDDVIYYDKLTIKNEQLFNMIKDSNEYPKSAAPSMLSIQNLFSYLRTYYKEIVVVTVSSKMSATYNVFKKVIDTYNDQRIVLIDSRQNSVAQGLVVQSVVEMIESHKSLADIVKETEIIREKTKILVHVDTLDNMVRSGRIKKSLGKLAKVLRLKPVVSIDQHGEGIVLSKSLGLKNNIKKIIKMVKKAHEKYEIKNYAIVHVNNIKLAEYLKTKIVEITGFMPLYISDISTVVAMNSGLGSVAVGYVRKD